ncbi:MAG: acyl-CoA thioesterase [Monoglobales bacterium]
MLIYTHKVHYYETDKMGITHHSNYIRWMEEARIAHLREIGLSFKSIEEMGYISPVVSLSVKYLSPTTFDDEILIETRLSKYSGVTLEVAYIMKNAADDTIVAKAKSKHCFIKDNQICSLERDGAEMDKILKMVLDK